VKPVDLAETEPMSEGLQLPEEPDRQRPGTWDLTLIHELEYTLN
jgi:hypothetical protein